MMMHWGESVSYAPTVWQEQIVGHFVYSVIELTKIG
jgi:hypothetical protein